MELKKHLRDNVRGFVLRLRNCDLNCHMTYDEMAEPLLENKIVFIINR